MRVGQSIAETLQTETVKFVAGMKKAYAIYLEGFVDKQSDVKDKLENFKDLIEQATSNPLKKIILI